MLISLPLFSLQPSEFVKLCFFRAATRLTDLKGNEYVLNQLRLSCRALQIGWFGRKGGERELLNETSFVGSSFISFTFPNIGPRLPPKRDGTKGLTGGPQFLRPKV